MCCIYTPFPLYKYGLGRTGKKGMSSCFLVINKIDVFMITSKIFKAYKTIEHKENWKLNDLSTFLTSIGRSRRIFG